MVNRPKDIDWRNDAACLPYIDLFDASHEALRYEPAALRICRTCPVQPECRADVMARETYAFHGVVGGLTARQRASIRRQLTRNRTDTA